MAGAAAVLAAALIAYLGTRMIGVYGAARQAVGAAEGRLAELPAILAANQHATEAAIDARDRVITAEERHGQELDRLMPLILAAQQKVSSYAESDAGRAACLGPDRVHGIAADRAALFPAATPEAASTGETRPVPAGAAADALRREPE